MKEIIFTVMISLLSTGVFGVCNDNTETYFTGNIGQVDVAGKTDILASSSGNNCGLNFEDDFWTIQVKLEIAGHQIPSILILPYLSADYTTFDIDAMRENLYDDNSLLSNWIVYNGNETVSEFVGMFSVWNLEIKVRLKNGVYQLGRTYTQKYVLSNPGGLSVASTLCSGVKYSFDDLIGNMPLGYLNPTFVFDNGDLFVNDSVILTQSINNELHFELVTIINSHLCKRDFYVNLHPRKEAYFTSVVQANGPITALSPSVLMSSMIYTNGGDLEYYGSGILNNGGTWYFDPSASNTQNVIVYVRTDNFGCKSIWRDTLFYVTPIVSSFSAPVLNLPATFGPGEYGNFLIVNTTGTNSLNGRFHYACSNKDYTYYVQSPNVGLTYEWKTIFQNFVWSNGTGTSYTVSTPDRINVLTNVASSLYSAEDHYNDLSLYHNGLMYFGHDLDGNGSVGSNEDLYTTNLGDELRVMVRAVDVFNNVSDWTIFTMGIVPSVELQDSSILCYEGNPILNPVTNTPIYLDSIVPNDQRSVRWDVNNDGIYELNGSIDNYLQFMTNTNKLNLMGSQIIDSIKARAWNPSTNQFYTVWDNQMSEVCVSNIDTVSVIRKPILSVSFSDVDTLNYGSSVLSIVSGSYFDPSSDSIAWQWNDGSGIYSGDSVWHYMNDLGDYSLNLNVLDHLGCNTDTLFVDHWYVPGILNIDELSQGVTLYPVPVYDNLTINSVFSIDVVRVIDVYGREVIISAQKEIDMSSLPSGTYQIIVEVGGNQINKCVIKM